MKGFIIIVLLVVAATVGLGRRLQHAAGVGALAIALTAAMLLLIVVVTFGGE